MSTSSSHAPPADRIAPAPCAVYLDTEFTNLYSPAPISVGMVTADGADEFYRECADVNVTACSAFVRRNVLPLLQGGICALGRGALAQAVVEWLDGVREGRPVTLLYDDDYDWHLLAELLRQPPAWLTGRCIAVAELNLAAIDAYFRAAGAPRHHALHDSRALRLAHGRG